MLNRRGKLGVVGLGYVGSALKHTLDFYYNCCGYDLNGNHEWNRIIATDVLFICVGTPERSGRLDGSSVEDVLLHLDTSGYLGIAVVRSTLPIGFMDKATRRHPKLRLVYMPEFLRERSRLQWTMNPDRLVVSGKEADVEEVLSYFEWAEEAQVLRMKYRDAELGKLANNAFLAVKVSFTNEIEALCEEHGASPENVMSVIWSDRRVKSKDHLTPGLGPYGGKCLPKDVHELVNASKHGILIKAADLINTELESSGSSRRRARSR